MAARSLSLFTIYLMGAIFIGTLEGLRSAPIPLEYLLLKDNMTSVNSDNTITVLFLACSEKATNEISIEPKPGKQDCINVNLPDAQTVISTSPKGVKLHLFKNKSCDGEHFLYDSNSSQKMIPFKVASFLIHH